MITGTIGFCTDQGLGIQTKAFFEHGLIQKILIQRHGSYENHYDWYTPEQKVNSVEELLDSCDRLIFFETLWDKWHIIPLARARGIKTIFVMHYECSKLPPPYWCDVYVAPSAIDYQLWQPYVKEIHRINIPVEMPFKKRTKAEVFVHNSGHGGLLGRNSTQELLDAMQYVKSPIKLIVRTQNGNYKSNDPRVEIIRGSVPYEQLFSAGDVFILPDKFGGSFLPMQEAAASGMVVLASDRLSNRWLKPECLIPTAGFRKATIAVEFDSAIISPGAIAERIDFWYGKDITRYSLANKAWAEQNSWEKLKPRYEAL